MITYYKSRKSFIAEPMKENDYYDLVGEEYSEHPNIDWRDGYYIVFPSWQDQKYPEGARAWLPKDIFEEFFGKV